MMQESVNQPIPEVLLDSKEFLEYSGLPSGIDSSDQWIRVGSIPSVVQTSLDLELLSEIGQSSQWQRVGGFDLSQRGSLQTESTHEEGNSQE